MGVSVTEKVIENSKEQEPTDPGEIKYTGELEVKITRVSPNGIVTIKVDEKLNLFDLLGDSGNEIDERLHISLGLYIYAQELEREDYEAIERWEFESYYEEDNECYFTIELTFKDPGRISMLLREDELLLNVTSPQYLISGSGRAPEPNSVYSASIPPQITN